MREIEESHGIKADEKVKVLIVTALEKTNYVMSGLMSEREHYLCKPVTLTTIADPLEKLSVNT